MVEKWLSHTSYCLLTTSSKRFACGIWRTPVDWTQPMAQSDHKRPGLKDTTDHGPLACAFAVSLSQQLAHQVGAALWALVRSCTSIWQAVRKYELRLSISSATITCHLVIIAGPSACLTSLEIAVGGRGTTLLAHRRKCCVVVCC